VRGAAGIVLRQRCDRGKLARMTDAEPSPIVTVFRSRLRADAGDNGYYELAERMEARARAMPGFIDFKTFSAPDGERVSIVVFRTMGDQQSWRKDPEHEAAQHRGRADLYEEYSISVCEERRHHSFQHDGTIGTVA